MFWASVVCLSLFFGGTIVYWVASRALKEPEDYSNLEE